MKINNKIIIPITTCVYSLYYYIYFQYNNHNTDIYKYI